MANKTYLDELIGYKHQVVATIAASQNVVGLLVNNPNVDMSSDVAYDVVGTKIYDFDYVNHTVQRTDAYICVDSELVSPSSGMINKWYLYVQVICEKIFNALDPKIFKGVRGNRRDNLVREIDLLLNGRRDFGIGRLELINAAPATVPDSFTSFMLTYEIHDFRQERL